MAAGGGLAKPAYGGHNGPSTDTVPVLPKPGPGRERTEGDVTSPMMAWQCLACHQVYRAPLGHKCHCPACGDNRAWAPPLPGETTTAATSLGMTVQATQKPGDLQ